MKRILGSLCLGMLLVSSCISKKKTTYGKDSGDKAVRVSDAAADPATPVSGEQDKFVYFSIGSAEEYIQTFSDIANAISAEHGFWMDDAFASGGSAGYDHKGMGITAKGAWESVKRHFRELGMDCQTQPFTVVGVGEEIGESAAERRQSHTLRLGPHHGTRTIPRERHPHARRRHCAGPARARVRAGEDRVPGPAAVAAAIEAALGVRAPQRSHRRDVHDVRVLRMDENAADMP